ncbi:MAG: DUF1579 family protein [Kofleriaceae bacterium]
MRFVWLCLLLACSRPPATVPVPAPPATSKACSSSEHRQLDFWIGDWDVVVRARASPTSDQWGDAKGRQKIEAILGGCAISENFFADGPQTPWTGRSYSSWQALLGKWRQVWVDDQGGFLAFIGSVENGVMTLYGESHSKDGKAIQMRMVFLDVKPGSLRWQWQRTEDDWKTSTVMMHIAYTRRDLLTGR